MNLMSWLHSCERTPRDDAFRFELIKAETLGYAGPLVGHG